MFIKQLRNQVVSLTIGCGILFATYEVAYASINKPIGLQEAIRIALQENGHIQIAQNTRKNALLSNRIDHISLWAPKATFSLSQDNVWVKGMKSRHSLQSKPFFALSWEMESFVDKIFQTKQYGQKRMIDLLTAAKTIEEELQKVVTCHYALALAQKKGERLHTFIRIAATKLKIEEERLRLGFSRKIDCLNADLALKKAKLTALEHQETLKEKRRNLNLRLGKLPNEETLVESDLSVQPIWDITAVTKEKVVEMETAIQAKRVAMARIELTKVKCYPLSCLSLSGRMESSSYTYGFNERKWDMHPYNTALKISMGIDLGKLLLMPAAIRKAKMAWDNEVFHLTQKKRAAEDGLEDKKWKYRHMLGLHKLAKEQLKVTNQKLHLIKENYRLNQLKLLDLQEAEEERQNAEINLIEKAFKVKEAEFELYSLMGKIYNGKMG